MTTAHDLRIASRPRVAIALVVLGAACARSTPPSDGPLSAAPPSAATVIEPVAEPVGAPSAGAAASGSTQSGDLAAQNETLRARVLVLEARLEQARAEAASAQRAKASVPPALAPELESELQNELASVRADATALRARLSEVERSLGESQASRIEREREWMRFVRLLDARGLSGAAPVAFDPELPEEMLEPSPPLEAHESAEPKPDVDAARIERTQQLCAGLRSMLWVEGQRGLDLLEGGALGAGWIGPVVFRTLDADGRLSGVLRAERLRLEASRAARTLTLVLETGYESHAGVKVEFERPEGDPTRASARRIVLYDLDPMPWVEAMPELFGSAPLDEVRDDGRHDKELVRAALNELLKQDAFAGWLRIESIEGIVRGTLHGVHAAAYAPGGGLEKRIFADRLRLVRQGPNGRRGILLCFEDGALERAGERQAFLDGRWTLYLPRAEPELFEAAKIPLEVIAQEAVGARADKP